MKSLIILAALAAPVSAAQDACPDWKKNPEKWTCLSVPSAAPAEKTVLNDAEAWAKLWLERTGAATAPSVDFAAETIVADGERVVKIAKASDAKNAIAAAALAEAEAEQAAAGERVAPLLAQGFSARRDGFVTAAASCTPGVDCPAEKKPQPKKPGCTPGVDCPTAPKPAPRPQQPRGCTPGVDCPTNRPEPRRPSCTPGVDCAGDRERNERRPSTGDAPLPRNYRPRPVQPPAYFPPITGGYDLFPGDVTGWWHPVRNIFGQTHDEYGPEDLIRGESVIRRAGSELGQQGTRYTAQLSVSYSRPIRRLHWRYVGYECDPYDSSSCEEWRIQYGWWTVDHSRRAGPTQTVVVRFEDDMPLLPWGSETIGLSYDGMRVSVDTSRGDFQYQVRGPFMDENGVVQIVLKPVARRLLPAEADKVVVRLVRGAVEVTDLRSQFYAGEELEVTVEVKKNCGSWCFDKVVPTAPLRVTVKPGPVQGLIPVAGSGEHYITWMRFRRLASQYSSAAPQSNSINVGKRSAVRW